MLRCLGVTAVFAAAQAHAQLDGSVISLEDPAIGYRSQTLENPVADLQQRIAQGKTELAFDARPGIGYLPAVLDELGVPLESQLLVYSKTSLQQHLITPDRPRAIYFSDELAVGAGAGWHDRDCRPRCETGRRVLHVAARGRTASLGTAG